MLTPLNDNVLVRKLDGPEKSKGGIIIPKNAQDQDPAFQAEVLSVGPGKQLENGERGSMGVSPGDTVVIGRYTGQTVTLDGKECLVIRYEDVLGVVEA